MAKIFITGGSGFIGSYLIDVLRNDNTNEILNVDIAPPPISEHVHFWLNVDILDTSKLEKAFDEFKPDLVVHLAARTDTDPDNKLSDYEVNTVGTENVLRTIKRSKSVKRVIITSTQFVHQYKGVPENDEDFAPHTIYGESKVLTEKATRKAQLECIWTIIRPTNIWGPRHPRYPNEFWKVLKQGKYFHPGSKRVMRSYGYVGNVVDQIIQISQKDGVEINGQVFYVGDEVIDLYDWANGFSIALNKKKVKKVPRFFVKGLAIVGDALRLIKIRFPITTSRYKSMTVSNSAPMQKTFKVLGEPKYTLQQGIGETAEWLKKQGEFWE